MSGLIGGLINNTQALSVHSKALQVTGRNLANVNNPNYSRQRVTTEATAGPGGMTYEQAVVQQLRDAILDRNIVSEAGNTGRLDALQSLHDRLNQVLGEGIDSSMGASLGSASPGTRGLTGAISSFFNAWEGLSATPNDVAAQKHVFLEAQNLVSKLNQVSSDLNSIEADHASALDTELGRSNALLEQIHSLNDQIVRVEGRKGGVANELRDLRQKALEDLGQLMDFDSELQPDGRVTLTTGLQGAEANLLDERGPAIISKADVGLTAALDGVSVDFNPEKGSLSVLAPSGADLIIADFRRQVDGFSSQLINSVNTLYDAGATGEDFFSGTTAADISLALVDSRALKPSGNVASAIADLATTDFSTAGGDQIDGSIADFAVNMATERASAVADIAEKREHQALVENLLMEQRSEVSGVSMDEELSDMMRLQNAFQASARVVNAINSMLELVTTRLGA